MPPIYHIALRSAQGVFSVAVLALSSYIASIQNQTGYHSATQISFLIFASAFSMFSLVLLELGPRLSAKASNQYLTLAVQALNSGFYMGGFIALSVFLGKLMYCQGSICSAAKADAVLGACSYVAWVASTTMQGIQMSRFGKKYEQNAESSERVSDKRSTDDKGSMA
ncbi:hypothetical protein VTL71DRAFT_9095 [Oculimacula yallundae]|uniref:MARVEL domain-containing protein n=1 Tax=Oculimacula yallundae TaxID=86028 RepID=A0ABR4BWE0_9HELO